MKSCDMVGCFFFFCIFFFFSSRRRHTRYWRDWSSDVCSSDLINMKILTKKYLGRLPSFHNLDLFELDNRNGIYSDFNDICKLPIRCRYFWPASFVSGHPKK